jgi:hypothetical protein
MRPTILPVALRLRPFTRAQAFAAGVGRGVLDGPTVRRLHHGVYVAADLELRLTTRVEAALLSLAPSTIASGVTALWLHGAKVGQPMPLRFVSSHPHQVRRSELVVTRVAKLPTRRGQAVSPEHAFVTAALQLDLVDLVAAGDRLVRLRRCTVDALRAYAESYRGPGCVTARRAAGLVRERVDSVRETRLRLCLVLAGLPEPRCNVVLGTDERPIGRVDLLLEKFMVIVEYEGDQYRTDPVQWSTDISRGEAFGAAGIG